MSKGQLCESEAPLDNRGVPMSFCQQPLGHKGKCDWEKKPRDNATVRQGDLAEQLERKAREIPSGDVKWLLQSAAIALRTRKELDAQVLSAPSDAEIDALFCASNCCRWAGGVRDVINRLRTPALQAPAQRRELENFAKVACNVGYMHGRDGTDFTQCDNCQAELKRRINSLVAGERRTGDFEAVRHGERCDVCGNSACECLPSEKDLAHGTQEEE